MVTPVDLVFSNFMIKMNIFSSYLSVVYSVYKRATSYMESRRSVKFRFVCHNFFLTFFESSCVSLPCISSGAAIVL